MHHDQGFERIEHHMDHTLDNRKREREIDVIVYSEHFSLFFIMFQQKKNHFDQCAIENDLNSTDSHTDQRKSNGKEKKSQKKML